jgi:hypothetical protein
VLAGLLVFVALVSPNRLAGLGPGALLRIPVEGLVAAALVLVLPTRVSRAVAASLGALLGVSTVLTLLDLGFDAALARPFDPMLDWGLLGYALGFLTDSIGRVGALACAAAAAVLAVAVAVLMTVSAVRLARVAARHRVTAARGVALLAVAWIGCAVLGARVSPGLPVAAASTATLARDHALQVRADLRDRVAFAAELGHDAFRDIPGDRLLTGLRGKDVMLTFIESYGRSAVADPRFAPAVGALLADGDRRLASAGFASRSAFLTSPTYGGGSWLAHATLLSGLWIDDQQRFTALEASDRLTLTRAFARASWRTVGVMPGVTEPWPEASFYGYDKVYPSWELGYRGPRFSFATMPDQYTLLTFQRDEVAVPRRPPLMSQVVLVSSHAPWSPLPRAVPWAEVGDGSVYDSMAGQNAPPQAILSRDPAQVRADYLRSIEYSLDSLISYVQTFGDDHLVLVFLGDHQPSPVVTGPDASRDVPVTVVTRDRALLDRISGWGWQEGLRPGPGAPVWRMDSFRDRFLTTFGPGAGPAAPAAH